jgi:hypothetical protein
MHLRLSNSYPIPSFGRNDSVSIAESKAEPARHLLAQREAGKTGTKMPPFAAMTPII